MDMEKPLEAFAVVESMTVNPQALDGITAMLFLNMADSFFMFRNGIMFYALSHPNVITGVRLVSIEEKTKTDVLPTTLITQLPMPISQATKTNLFNERLEAICQNRSTTSCKFLWADTCTHDGKKKIIDRIHGILSPKTKNVVQKDPVNIFITTFTSPNFGGRSFDFIGRALLARFLPDLGSKYNWVYQSLREVLHDKCYRNVRVVMDTTSIF